LIDPVLNSVSSLNGGITGLSRTDGAGNASESSDSTAETCIKDSMGTGSETQGPARLFSLTSIPDEAGEGATIDGAGEAIANSAATASVPGIAGAVLSGQLKQLAENKVKFFIKRRFYIPRLMKPYKELTLEKTEKILERGSEGKRARLRVEVNAGTLAPVRNRDDINELAAYSIGGAMKDPQREKLARFLQNVEKEGYKIWTPAGEAKGAFAAFKWLVDPSPLAKGKPPDPVQISRAEVVFLVLTPDNKYSLKEHRSRFGEFQKAYEGMGKDAHLARAASGPVPDVSLKDRMELLEAIVGKDSYYKSNLIEDYTTIASQSKNREEFQAQGLLYKKMQAAVGNWSSCVSGGTHREGVKLITERLKDHPDEGEVFIDTLKSGLSLPSTVKIHGMLAEPVNEGDYKKAAGYFAGDKSWTPERIEQAMKPPHDAPLKERISLLKGLEPHIRDNYYDRDNWKGVVSELDYVREHTKDGAEFSAISALYTKMLDSFGKKEFSEDYHKGFDFISRRLKDHAGEFTVFDDLLKSGVTMGAAVKIFDCLPQPVKNGDYEKAASLFKGDEWWGATSVEHVMKPVGTSSLDERVKIHKGLRKHAYEYQELTGQYDRLAQDPGSFVKMGKEYLEILDADPNQRNYNRQPEFDGIHKVLKERFQDHPEERRIFVDLLKSGLSMDTTKRIFDSLPQPVKDGEFAHVAGHFLNDKSWTPDRVEQVMKPPLDAPLADRINLLQALERHVRSDYYNRVEWKQVMAEFDFVRGACKDGAEFTKLSGLYAEMLDAFGKTEFSDNYHSGFDLISRRLKDHPDEFKVFTDLLKSGVTMGAAVKVFDMLPQPLKDGDYEKAAACFKGDEWWGATSVEHVMKPVGTSSLEERVGIHKGLRKHAYEYQELTGQYDRLALEPGSFVKMGKEYLEILDADPNQRNYSRQPEFDGIHKILKDRFRDHPEERKVFVDLLKSGLSMPTTQKIFDMVPQPPKDGEFGRAADHFIKDKSWTPERVEQAMKPPLDAPLADRISLLKGLEDHIYDDYYNRPKWQEVVKDFDFVRQRSRDGRDFAKLSGCYVRMLDAYGKKSFSEACHRGFDFIDGCVKDKGWEFDVFEDLLRSGVQMDAAIKIRETLPSPVGEDDYKSAAALFKGDQQWDAKAVESVMKGIDSMGLGDRVDIMKNIRNFYWDSKYVNAYERIRTLTADTHDFRSLAGKFIDVLEACKGNRNDGEAYDRGLEFIAANLRANQAGYGSFKRLVEGAGNISRAIEAYEKIQAPVQGESYDVRERAALHLIKTAFAEAYAIASAHIVKGETVEDSAALLNAIIVTTDRFRKEECESLLTGLLEKKGAVPSSQITGLLKSGIFDVRNPQELFKTVEVLSIPVKKEGFKVREDVFLTIFNEEFKGEQYSVGAARERYSQLTGSMDKDETLLQSVDRLTMIRTAITAQTGKWKRVDVSDAWGLYDFIAVEKKKGNFGDATVQEITSALVEELVMSHNAEDAKTALLFRFKAKADAAVDKDDEDFINIGGIKLEKKKHKAQEHKAQEHG
jgi:hypothetical protein